MLWGQKPFFLLYNINLSLWSEIIHQKMCFSFVMCVHSMSYTTLQKAEKNLRDCGKIIKSKILEILQGEVLRFRCGIFNLVKREIHFCVYVVTEKHVIKIIYIKQHFCHVKRFFFRESQNPKSQPHLRDKAHQEEVTWVSKHLQTFSRILY